MCFTPNAKRACIYVPVMLLKGTKETKYCWCSVSFGFSINSCFCKPHVFFPLSHVLLCKTGMFRVYIFSPLKFSLSSILEFLILLRHFKFMCHFPRWKWNLLLTNSSTLFLCSVVDLLILRLT